MFCELLPQMKTLLESCSLDITSNWIGFLKLVVDEFFNVGGPPIDEPADVDRLRDIALVTSSPDCASGYAQHFRHLVDAD
jgi:hypothetical protein